MKKISTEKLANMIVGLRKSKNMTQIQLADATGINRAMIGRIENKDYIPTVEQLQNLGEVLGFEVTDLFAEEISADHAKSSKPEKSYNIAVAGTGYVGLSIATLLAQHNHVTAVDIIPDRLSQG